MSYIATLIQKTFKRRLGKNIGTLIAISLGVSLMVGVQITITSFATEAIDFFVEAIGENDIIITGFSFPISNYQNIVDKIDSSPINYTALNIRISQSVAIYNLESGELEKGVSYTGIELDEDPVFGSFYDTNGSKITQSELSNIFSNETNIMISENFAEELNVTLNSVMKVRVGELNSTALLFDYKTFDVTVAELVKEEGKGKELGGRTIWTSIENMRSIVGFGPNECSEISIALSGNHEEFPVTNEYAKEVEDELIELLEGDNVIVIAFRALILETADEVLQDVLLAFNLFGALIIFSGVLLLVNIQLIQVEDRINQLGILRAIGARRREIIRMILLESAILGLLGSFLGVAGGYGMSRFLVWQIGKTFFDGEAILQPIVTWGAIGYSLAIGLILAIGAGIFPAIRASRVDVIEVIRGIKKVSRKKAGNVTLAVGIAFILAGISVFTTHLLIFDSFFTAAGWNTAIEQWTFMGASAGILLGVSILLGYFFSKKIMSNGIGLTFIVIAVLMLLLSLPQLTDLRENNKILITLAIVLALGTIIWVGVNLSAVTNFIRNILYKTRMRKGVSLIASKYMTSKAIRSTLTFGIFTLVLTMNIFASVYQSTFAYNTLESVEFLSGGASIFVELDTPVSNISLVNVEEDLYQVDNSITNVQGINSTLAFIQTDEDVEDLEIPSDFFPSVIDLIYNDTFKTGDDYTFDFIFEQSVTQLNDKYKPAASESYQLEYSHEIWDFFYNRTKFNKEGFIDDENGLPTVISTSMIFLPGDVFNLTNFYGNPTEVIVLATMRLYPFSISSSFPALLITPDLYPFLYLNFALYPKHTKYLVSTNEDFRTGRNSIIAEEIEEFFNGNDSVLIQTEDFVAASATNVWDEMLEIVDFQVRTFDFMQYFVSFGLVVGALGMVIIAVRNVSERRREIGMMRASGYKKRQIIGSIMIELFILAILGLVMGIINSILLGWALARVFDWLLIIPVVRVLIYTGIMIGIALLASIIPGIRASQITPAESIRYVG